MGKAHSAWENLDVADKFDMSVHLEDLEALGICKSGSLRPGRKYLRRGFIFMNVHPIDGPQQLRTFPAAGLWPGCNAKPLTVCTSSNDLCSTVTSVYAHCM